MLRAFPMIDLGVSVPFFQRIIVTSSPAAITGIFDFLERVKPADEIVVSAHVLLQTMMAKAAHITLCGPVMPKAECLFETAADRIEYITLTIPI